MANVTPNRRRPTMDPELEKRIEQFGHEAATVPETQPIPATPASASSRATVGFNFKMTPEDHRKLKALCAREERSIQYMLNKIVWPTVESMIGNAERN
ncbi:hypothetical protein ACTXJX_13215 [Glutamicibacter ardleyensis]|uniref:hypothetical protein n=1 Tax=Glutamicibacter ardleyensis TaxID=225894 RepID=UPI003FD1498D